MSTNYKELDFLIYLAPEYREFLAKQDLSNVITIERKLENALFEIQNDYKDGGWAFVVDNDPTHGVQLRLEANQYTTPTVPTRPSIDDGTLSTCQLKAKQAEYHNYCVCIVQCLKLLETVFIILKSKSITLGTYKPDFTVKDAFVFLKA